MMKDFIDKASHRLMAFPHNEHRTPAGGLKGIAIDRFIDFSSNQQNALMTYRMMDLLTHRLGAQSPDPQSDSEPDR